MRSRDPDSSLQGISTGSKGRRNGRKGGGAGREVGEGGERRDKTKSKPKRRRQHELRSKNVKRRKTGKDKRKGENRDRNAEESQGKWEMEGSLQGGSRKEQTAISSLVYPKQPCLLDLYRVLSLHQTTFWASQEPTRWDDSPPSFASASPNPGCWWFILSPVAQNSHHHGEAFRGNQSPFDQLYQRQRP